MSRALAQVSRQHGFRVEEVLPPYDGKAVMRAGHPLPHATRLSEGCGRRAAGDALEESLVAALRRPRCPVGVAGPGVAVTTKEFVDAVLGLLPSVRRDTEFALGVGR